MINVVVLEYTRRSVALKSLKNICTILEMGRVLFYSDLEHICGFFGSGENKIKIHK